MAEWLLSTRGADGRLTGNLPIKQTSGVLRHLGVGAGVATVPWSLGAYQRLIEGAGVVIYRNGKQLDTGFLVEIEESWPGDIKVPWVSEQVLLQDHLVIPDPTQPADYDTNGKQDRYPGAAATRWTYTGLPSTVMTQLIAQQMGPAAHAVWRVPGLTVGPDPLLGGSPITASIRFGSPNLLAELQTISAASYADLGVRVDATASGLVAQVVGPVDAQATARFSVDLGNLTSYSRTRKAPAATNVIVGGKPLEPPNNVTLTEEEKAEFALLNTPIVTAATTDPISLAWGRKIWTYRSRSDVSDRWDRPALVRAAAEEAATGEATAFLTCTLRDTERLKFGVDWGLGYRVTVDVGRPDGPKTPVVDVVREVAFEYGPDGEKITPAIGSAGATALPTLPSRQTLNKIKARLAGLERSN